MIFKTPFARVAAALWSLALALVLAVIALTASAPSPARHAQTAQAVASVQPHSAQVRTTHESSPMLRTSGHAIAKDKLD